MNNFKKILLIVFLVVTGPVHAHSPSEGKVTALFGPFLYKTNFEGGGADLQSPTLGGFGLIAEGDISKHGGLEIAMFYQHKLYFLRQTGNFIAEKAKIMYITMGYRHWFMAQFSAAAAFFSSYSMGDPNVIHGDFAPGFAPRTSAQDTTEYGFDFSLQWELWGNDKYAVVLDGRYSWSVTSKNHEDSDHYGALLGWRYQVQEK